LSGGSDSLLLLQVLAETRRPFALLRFADGWTRQQRAVVDDLIVRHDLTVFSYPPVSFFLFGKDDDLTFASFYAIDARGNTFPLLRDIVDGEKCAFDIQIEAPKMTQAPIEFSAHILGTRFDDEHYSFKQRPLLRLKEWQSGTKIFFAPLADWTQREVYAALLFYGIEYKKADEQTDTGNISACARCLKTSEKVICPKTETEIDGVLWDKEKNLKDFQQFFV